MRTRWRHLDRLALASTALSLAFLGARAVVGRGTVPFGGPAATLTFYGVGVLVALGCHAAAGGSALPPRLAGRGFLYFLAAVSSLTALSRLPKVVRGEDGWPPAERDIDGGMAWLSDEERARWVVSVLAHALSARRPETQEGALPGAWPLPGRVRRVVEQRGDTIRITALATDGAVECVASLHDGVLLPAGPHAEPIRCTSTRSARAAAPTEITRVALRGLDYTSARSKQADWPQFRRNARREAALGSQVATATGWIGRVDGEIRSSVSVAAGSVFAGTHGNGALARIDLATGRTVWRVTVPNWIHSDPVSDGQVVAVGFGDSGPSFTARAPAGVAAYRVSDGVLLWTAFEPNSVMTSPILLDSVVVYATASGALRVRALGSGAMLRTAALSGAVTMAPPVMSDGLLVVGLDDRRICAVHISDLRTRWCVDVPDARFEGHSAPSVFGDTVVASGVVPLSLFHLARQLHALGPGFAAKLAWNVALHRSSAAFGQAMLALRLADGMQIWRSGTYAGRRIVEGHMSGTAAEANGIGVVVLPLADRVVGFEVSSGQERWTSPADGARGAPLVVEGRVYVFAPTGRMRVLRLTDGHTLCAVQSPFAFDRAGPAVAGGLLIAGALSGDVVGIPRPLLDECRQEDLARLFSVRSTQLQRPNAGHR